MLSAKDLATQTQLKYRADGQGSEAEIARKDLKAALAEKERDHTKKFKGSFDEERSADLRLLEATVQVSFPERLTAPILQPNAADADYSDDSRDGSSSEDDDGDGDGDDDDDDDDDDEEAELLAELERIKRERAEDAARKAADGAEQLDKAEASELLRGNPLLAEKLIAGEMDVSFALKRRWDEDVVFRNQAQGEPKVQRRFINDTIRSDFHRRFLDKYMR